MQLLCIVLLQVNSVTGFCLTKLDVLDGLEELKICTGYKTANQVKLSLYRLQPLKVMKKLHLFMNQCLVGLKKPVGATSIDAITC